MLCSKDSRSRAPARPQRWCSSRSSCNMLSMDGCAPWRTQEFLCFHRIHVPNITIELKPFLFPFGVRLQLFLHHSARVWSFWDGTFAVRPKGDSTLNQNSRANTHPTRMCWVVSSSWSHKVHLSRCGRFLYASLSAVQHLFRMASKRKTLHLAGLHVFQSLFQGSKVIAPLKNAR